MERQLSSNEKVKRLSSAARRHRASEHLDEDERKVLNSSSKNRLERTTIIQNGIEEENI